MKKYDKYDVETIERMIDGKLPWLELRLILSEEKDNDRFEKVMEIMQKRVSWKEKILLPLHEHLYIVSKEGKRIVKCDCGYEF
ncbi:MAG: acetone carboxylase subunit gamma, partial [Chloroflexi bacterium CG15_BIG_FIL_POST_REV_8_21_14_020_46_15]